MKAVAVIFIGISAIVCPAWAAASLCTVQEQIVFSCSLRKKTVSVCASADLSAHGGYLQYRVGKPEAVELMLPESIAKFSRSSMMQAKSLMFSGGGGGYLRFIHGTYTISSIPRSAKVGVPKTALR